MRNSYTFIQQENAFENVVWKMAAIDYVSASVSYGADFEHISSALQSECRKTVVQWQCSFHLKAALPLVKRLVRTSDRNSNSVQ